MATSYPTNAPTNVWTDESPLIGDASMMAPWAQASVGIGGGVIAAILVVVFAIIVR